MVTFVCVPNQLGVTIPLTNMESNQASEVCPSPGQPKPCPSCIILEEKNHRLERKNRLQREVLTTVNVHAPFLEQLLKEDHSQLVAQVKELTEEKERLSEEMEALKKDKKEAIPPTRDVEVLDAPEEAPALDVNDGVNERPAVDEVSPVYDPIRDAFQEAPNMAQNVNLGVNERSAVSPVYDPIRDAFEEAPNMAQNVNLGVNERSAVGESSSLNDPMDIPEEAPNQEGEHVQRSLLRQLITSLEKRVSILKGEKQRVIGEILRMKTEVDEEKLKNEKLKKNSEALLAEKQSLEEIKEYYKKQYSKVSKENSKIHTDLYTCKTRVLTINEEMVTVKEEHLGLKEENLKLKAEAKKAKAANILLKRETDILNQSLKNAMDELLNTRPATEAEQPCDIAKLQCELGACKLELACLKQAHHEAVNENIRMKEDMTIMD